MTTIKCDKCGQEITKKEDLVVTSYNGLPIFRKYHNTCYAGLEKETFFRAALFNQPINSKVYTIRAVFALIFGMIFLFFFLPMFLSIFLFSFNEFPLIFKVPFLLIIIPFLLAFMPVFNKIYCYYKFEKSLSEKGDSPAS